MDDKKYPERKSHRLKYYDYSRCGAYFITICTYKRQKLFGEINFDENGKILSIQNTEKYPNGHTVGADSISARMVTDVYYELIGKYDGYGSLGFVVMPDHVHFVVSITRADMESAPTGESGTRADIESAPTGESGTQANIESSRPSIPEFVQEFKRYTTIKFINLVKQNVLPPFKKHVWQRGYYDHVIRDHDDLLECRKYIKNNPAKRLYEMNV